VDEIESIAHELATVFAAGLTQTGSVQVILADGYQRSQTYDATGSPARIGHWDGLLTLMARIKQAESIGGTFVAELTMTGSQDYMVAYSGDVPSLPPRVVFDADYRYPNHPKSGMATPAAAVNHGRSTDPAVLAEVRALITEFVERYTQLRGEPPQFAPGYTEDEVFMVEERLGVRLPEDLRALYRTIHDGKMESGLLGRYSPAPLEQVVAWDEEATTGSYGPDDGLFEYDPVVFETHPYGHVRRLSHSDWWVTFAPDYGMNYAAVDLDPAGLGTYGQILTFGRDIYGPIVYVAPSVRHLMRGVIASMSSVRPGDADEECDAGEWSIPNHEWLIDIGDAVLADKVAAVADASSIQKAHLRQVDQVDLADLAGFPFLRSIRVLDVRQKAGHVDLSVPCGLPVEHVHVVAERFEPHRLATTPTIAYVTLGGNTEPVRVAALADLPNLVRLDLAEAAVTDVVSIAAFPALHVLILNARQWDELLRVGWTPGSLAAAGLGGHPSVAESAAWLTTIRGVGHPAVRYRTIRGRL
jgi:cell wall assembly regulator SMI1